MTDFKYPYNPDNAQNCKYEDLLMSGAVADEYAGGINKLPADLDAYRNVILDETKGAIVACIWSDNAVKTYQSGVIVPSKQGCNLGIAITGYGYSGLVEWEGARNQYDPYTMPACSPEINCVQQGENDLRFNPSWGTSWGENGFATIRGYVGNGLTSAQEN